MPIKKESFKKLVSYAQTEGTELLFAIYWSFLNVWTLLSADDFCQTGSYFIMPFETAMKRNQMALLGDAFIGTVPPLSIRLYPNKELPHSADENGELEFTIGEVKLVCRDSIITSENERRIAMALILFGDWNETCFFYFSDTTVRELNYVEYSYAPEEYDEKQGFAHAGCISTIVSRQYSKLTAPHGKIERLSPDISPGLLGFVVPEPYESEELPLWRFHLKPNYD